MRQLARLKKLRAARERLSEASVAVEAGKLRLAEERLLAAKDAEAAGARESQRAVEAGERTAWMLSLALREAEAMRRPRLEAACREREIALVAAQRILNVCRVETEQASGSERDLREALDVEQERRAQAESDDRFLARVRWCAGLRKSFLPNEQKAQG